jgi:subfamily B ATP-binding cassette protein MsbA
VSERPEPTPDEVVRRLAGHLRPHAAALLFALLAMSLTVVAQTGLAALMKPLLDETFVARSASAARAMPLAIIGLFVLRGLATFVSSYLLNHAGRAVIKQLRGEMFRHLLDMPVAYYDRSSSAALVSRITYNIEQLAESTTQVVTVLVRDGLSVIGLLGLMVYLSPQLALYMFITVPIIYLLVKVVSGVFRRYSTRIQTSMGDVTRAASEVISGQRVVKMFQAQAQETGRFEAINEHNRRLHMKLALARSGSVPIVEFLASVGIAGIVFFASRGDNLDAITVGTFVSFLTAALLLAPPAKHLMEVNAPLQRGIAAGASVFALLDEPLEDQGRGAALARCRGELRFEDLRFRYGADKPEVLRDVSFEVLAGQTVAIVGRSGSGKSTLVGLVPRFYAPSAGRILLDGQPLDAYSLHDLRRQIALVSQDIVLFDDTVAANIAYGALAGASEAQLRAAAAAAQALEFIEALPQGFATRVGDRGVLLSGGQRQRIAIARALLKDAPLLILDEATSALDSEAERSIQRALEALMQGRTTLVIAHRLSTVERADRIVVLDRGELVESGTHSELLARGGVYAGLHRLQFREADGAGS